MQVENRAKCGKKKSEKKLSDGVHEQQGNRVVLQIQWQEHPPSPSPDSIKEAVLALEAVLLRTLALVWEGRGASRSPTMRRRHAENFYTSRLSRNNANVPKARRSFPIKKYDEQVT